KLRGPASATYGFRRTRRRASDAESRGRYRGARRKWCSRCLEKDAAGLTAPQNGFALFEDRRGGVLFHKLLRRDAQVLGEALHVAFRDVGFGHFAAVSTGTAIHLIFDLFGNPAKAKLGKVVALEVFAEALVLGNSLFPEALDLD